MSNTTIFIGCSGGKGGGCAGAKTPPFPSTQPIYCFYNYLISVHVQPDDGQHLRPKHVVVPSVVNA